MSFLGKRGKLARTVIASAATLVLFVSSPVFALSTGDLVSAGSVWLETTIAVALVFVTAMAFSLQIARGYFLRTLEKFTLRLGADIWWLAYVLIRDALIFLSFVMGLMVFFPGTFQDYPMAVPFMPLAVVFFGMALITKLYFDADESRSAFRAVTVFVFLGTFLWIFGTIFITETPLALPTLPSAVSGNGGFWQSIYNTFSSQSSSTNTITGISGVDLSMITFYVCSAALSVIAVLGFAHPILHSRIGGKRFKAVGQQSQGPVSPATFPARVEAGRDLPPVTVPERTTTSSVQASAPPARDRVEYIQ
jgi:hypothetical protein